MKIYTVTTVRSPKLIKQGGLDRIDWGHYRKRTVGWFSNTQRAIDAVLENAMDIAEEGYYDLVVIEESEEGIYMHPTEDEEWWYKWKNNRYEKTEKPEIFKNVVGFGMG
jgi:hypothetical protein